MLRILDRFAFLWAALFAVAFAVNFLAHRPGPVDFTSEAARVSLALQQGQGFSNPFKTGSSGPTAHVAPLYPFLHAAVCSIFGTGVAGGFAIFALTTLVWSLQAALVQRFASLHAHPIAGLAAALLLAWLPLPGRLFKWEAVFAAAVIAGGACLVSFLLARRGGAGSGILFGVVMAAGTLLNPATAVIWAAWACLLVWKLGVRPSAKLLLPAAIAFLIPVGAWTARNYSLLRHLTFVRDNTGLELAVSYNDCAPALLAENISSGCYARFHPNVNPEIERELAAMGEFEFNAMRQAGALAWIRGHPARALRLTLGHAVLFWFPIDRSEKPLLLNGIVLSLVTVLSFLGIAWRKSDGFLIAVTALAAFSAVYYLVQSEQRYRYPVLWISVLLVSIGVEAALGFRRGAFRR